MNSSVFLLTAHWSRNPSLLLTAVAVYLLHLRRQARCTISTSALKITPSL
jgi:hypothetical protein